MRLTYPLSPPLPLPPPPACSRLLAEIPASFDNSEAVRIPLRFPLPLTSIQARPSRYGCIIRTTLIVILQCKTMSQLSQSSARLVGGC